ncbi:cytochrome P450 [Allorhizocola rhizosphaerae]|uniref:cytochrome P450 n=1 Tax=Allorhizocola rhizosphaerae TaxID=1872709 RepID=UPI0013C35CE0|nr:cytochrome P450 [Allorhizocola rhizosphaerae]
MAELFPWHRPDPLSEPPEYQRLRESETPVRRVRLRTGIFATVVTRYDDVRELLADTRASSDRAHPGYPYYIPVPQAFRTDSGFLGMDPPAHTVQRRLAVVSGEFTKIRVRALMPRLREIVDGCIDKMIDHGPPVDLVRMLALRVPLTAVCGILGIPESDHDFLHDHTDILLGGGSSPQERLAAMEEVNAYLQGLVARRERQPRDDLISRMISRYQKEEIYNRRDMVNNLRLMINAGHETTAAMIALGVMTLLDHPDQLDLLMSDPEAHADNAVEELLRFITPADLAMCRVAKKDIYIGGVIVPAGEGIVLLGMSANRDPAMFAEPDRFDITRGSRAHLSFGNGPHHCIGAELARAELNVVFTRLFHRIPHMHLLKPGNELQFKDGSVVYSVFEMPVGW